MNARFRDWNTAGPIFFATCEACGERTGGCDLLTHDCSPRAARYWRERCEIEQRHARRLSFWLAFVCLMSSLAAVWRLL